MNQYPNQKQVVIPSEFFNIKYSGARIPGVDNQSDLSLGANCQVFSYALLAINGVTVPNFRSSDLWEDQQFSITTHKGSVNQLISFDSLQALDIMLYNSSDKAFGAHMAVYIGNGKIVHLSLANQYAEIIDHNTMVTRDKYRYFVGAKRIKA